MDHDTCKKIIIKKLEEAGMRIESPRSWIRGPIEPDILMYLESPNYSRPVLHIIEVKAEKGDHQRALYQLLATRLAMPNYGMYAQLYVAITETLYQELHRTRELSVFLKIMSQPLEETIAIDPSGETKTTYGYSNGIGVILVNEQEEIRFLTEPATYLF